MATIRRKRKGAKAAGWARRLLALSALLAAGSLTVVATRNLPPYRAADEPGLLGVFHIHSDSSHDGKVAYDELVEAGRRIDADFLVFTDHNKRPARQQPDSGPVIVSGSELSTKFGHLIQLGLDRVPPRAMRDSSEIVSLLHAGGAIAIAAHPESPKRPWDGPDDSLDGFEIASSSADFRAKIGKRYVGIAGPLAAFPVNSTLALAQLYRRDSAALARWDARIEPSVIGICGTDTHGWIAPHLQFRTWQIVLDLWDPPLAEIEPRNILDRIREGRFFCLAGLAGGGVPEFSFSALGPDSSTPQGGAVSVDAVLALLVRAPLFEASPSTIVLLRDGVEVERVNGTELRHERPGIGTYRVEVLARLPRLLTGGFEVPVLYSNRIRVTESPIFVRADPSPAE